ncbi:monooxygenase family protein [Polaribacter irgensii 23-P]|uniref:Monooxygenase family protein n=1 Tax=Polaribacter irgensii 23-P TaxID=313594 RepID=A4C008_9FLAO|nr:NAD(P)/FAD-dependent oxidoreductase [Polaribacter irgensii]EAR12751.1 monooxygenase family protein [Polaribacter irgensii 23-P]
MEKDKNKEHHWIACQDCKGMGKKRKRIPKKTRVQYQKALEQFETSGNTCVLPEKPKGHPYACPFCGGSGLITTNTPNLADHKNYPHIAIIGGGIGGVALAVACLHRGIPFTLYERDSSFNARSQGYGLTLQQGSKALAGLGIVSLKAGITSTRHVVHTQEGKIIGEWGIRKWGRSKTKTIAKRKNIHIARQALRLALLEQLGGHTAVQWEHQLHSFSESKQGDMNLSFQVNHEIKHIKADLIVGADGIRSTVRKRITSTDTTPLQYLDCMVILGICRLERITDVDRCLLDSATVFQTANGNERIYMMPYDSDSIMWQLSFPIAEEEAKILSTQGPEALKKEACRRIQWHDPIPQILAATQEAQVSGYPAYDRALLTTEILEKANKSTLIGDAAHPMSPFKGQGANQALLDALSLAREITRGCYSKTAWKAVGIRKSVLHAFETEMLARSSSKVQHSAEAASLLHTDIILREGNGPRGKHRIMEKK